MTGAAAIVVVDRVGFRYPGGVPALDDVSLRVGPRDVVGIAGANGAGKTTLARLLDGLLLPTSGRVTVDGRDTRHVPVHELARTVGLVFQHPRTQLFARTVADELAFGPRNLGLAAREVDERVAGAAARLGIEAELAAAPLALPGPLRRLVAIASVVAMAPRVLVLDEPTTGQDHRTSDRVAELVAGLAGDGVGVVCVSHDMRFLAGSASRLVALADGRVVADGSPRDVFADAAALDAAGLAAPQVTRLALALPGFVARSLPLTVPEMIGALVPGPSATGDEP
jgi:energy-coupling factor transport system ATP-binding protein